MPPLRGRPPGQHPGAPIIRPDHALVAAVRRVAWTPGRRGRPRGAGMFLCLPLLAQVRCARLVAQAAYPGSRMVPATRARLRLLALQWLDQERRSPRSDFHFDEALGLCAGLHILPKTTCATASAYRTQREPPPRVLAGWLTHLAPLLLPAASTVCLDFHPMPYRGDPTGRDAPDSTEHGHAGTRGLTLCAHEPAHRGVCDAQAHLPRAEQPGDRMRFGECWQAIPGHDPQWLSFDSTLVPDAALSRVKQRGLWLVTIRRRGAAL